MLNGIREFLRLWKLHWDWQCGQSLSQLREDFRRGVISEKAFRRDLRRCHAFTPYGCDVEVRALGARRCA